MRKGIIREAEIRKDKKEIAKLPYDELETTVQLIEALEESKFVKTKERESLEEIKYRIRQEILDRYLRALETEKAYTHSVT